MLHSYLDPLVLKAYRIPHLPFDQLPPLADYDTSQVLKARSFPVCVIYLPDLCKF